MQDTHQQGGADTWPTEGGHMTDIWTQGTWSRDTWLMQGDSKVNGGAAKAHSGRAHGGHTADTRRAHGGESVECGDAARAYRGQPFFLRENPTVNCLGNDTSIDPKQF